MHAISRAKERYNITLTKQDLNQFILDMCDGNVIVVARDRAECKCYVFFNGIALLCVIDIQWLQVRTFLQNNKLKRDYAIRSFYTWDEWCLLCTHLTIQNGLTRLR